MDTSVHIDTESLQGENTALFCIWSDGDIYQAEDQNNKEVRALWFH